MKNRFLLAVLSFLMVFPMLLTACQNELPAESSETSQEESEDTAVNTDNLAFGAFYSYEYGFEVVGDDRLTVLTDGDKETFAELCVRQDQTDLTYTDWYSKSHTVQMNNDCVAFSVDLGYVTTVKSIGLTMQGYTKEAIEIFASDDGYNFTNYLGAFDTFDGENFAIAERVKAKALLFVIPASKDQAVRISEIYVGGECNRTRELLSSAKNLSIDLGEVKNVSEVRLSVLAQQASAAPGRVTVLYSEDGGEWKDLGQSYLRAVSNADPDNAYHYLITRNHTVKARYLKVNSDTSKKLTVGEVSVYGCQYVVAEPEYQFITKKEQLSNTNVAAYTDVTFNDTPAAVLADMSFGTFVKGNEGKNTISIALQQPHDEICAVAINCKDFQHALTIQVNGQNVEFSLYESEVAGFAVEYLVFDRPDNGHRVDITLQGDTAPEISEVMVYAGQPQLPLVRGGFFQLPTGGGKNQAALNSEYSWYLQLKGMRDLGMEYVVIQYGAHFNAGTTLINGKNILAKGFRYEDTYGCEDVCLAVLNAAEKLGLKVYLGTMHDSDFTNPIANMESYAPLVDAAFAIIRDIDEMYGDHPAFAGYYLSDETCDAWLNLKGGVDAARYVYKNQSDLIRELDPEAKIMIAPAIWRSGKPEAGADNLYRMLAPEKEGGRPIIDIVAAQDCLGRESTLYVTDEAYKAYESYVEEWAKAVRRAGAEFWHDAEVFEITSTSKRYEDLVKSLAIEMKTSGSIIVFDIPHYFSPYSMAAFNDAKNHYKVRIVRDYVRYYRDWKALDAFGADAVCPDVITDDGKVVDTSGVLPVTKPVIETTRYHDGVLINQTPDASAVSTWYDFELGNASGTNPQYAMYWDDENLYVLLKTNDASASYGKGVWWEGKDDLVQIWMTADGKTANAALDSDSGIRYYIHRKGESAWQTGGEAGSHATFSGFSYEIVGDVMVIKMPWESLNLSVPSAGSGAVIGIKIQYIDGADGSWASSDGTKDQSVQKSALYSF